MTDIEKQEPKKSMSIFNMTDRGKGKLSIFTGGEWFKFAGKRAAYIYRMNDKVESQSAELLLARERIRTLEDALQSVDDLWEIFPSFRKEYSACEELGKDSPLFTVWKKVKAALKGDNNESN